MARLKVMLISGSYPPARCGVGDYTGFVSRELAKQGVITSVLTSSYLGTKPQSGGLNVIPEIDSWKTANLKKVIGIIKKNDPDIIHLQYPNLEYRKNLLTNLLPAALKLTGSRVKIAQTFHEPLNELTLLGRLRLLVNTAFADALIFVEKENMDSLPWYMKLAAKGKECAHIPVASNIPRQKAAPAITARMRKKYGINHKKKIFMTFGFITPVKGYEVLLENTDFKVFEWVHLGAHDTKDAYQNAFVKKAAEKGVNIHFTGHFSDVMTAKHLASAGMCVFPFKEGVTDRHGTYLAAVNQGVYCVAFHRQKTGYDAEKNTFYARTGDIRGFVEGMKRQHKNSGRKAMLPGWEKIAEMHRDIYEKTIRRKCINEN